MALRRKEKKPLDYRYFQTHTLTPNDIASTPGADSPTAAAAAAATAAAAAAVEPRLPQKRPFIGICFSCVFNGVASAAANENAAAAAAAAGALAFECAANINITAATAARTAAAAKTAAAAAAQQQKQQQQQHPRGWELGIQGPHGAPSAAPSVGGPWGPLSMSRRFAARTRRMREQQQQQRQQQPVMYTSDAATPYDPHQQQQQQQQQYGIGSQLMFAVASGAGVFLGFVLLSRLFGWGPRFATVHVDAQGRPVDPLTGAPLQRPPF
ncbi:hypothetical protein Emag_007233 [Eimeria magna]